MIQLAFFLPHFRSHVLYFVCYNVYEIRFDVGAYSTREDIIEERMQMLEKHLKERYWLIGPRTVSYPLLTLENV